jgi:hypothetical protein
METIDSTFDIIFNNDFNSNNLGFKSSFEYCKNYIDINNGTEKSYFENYKSGIVSIVCNENNKIVFETEVL